jgi:anaerobic ribonucleoside-triphosphate reductase
VPWFRGKKPDRHKACPYNVDPGGNMAIKCDGKTEVYSRVCGFFRPVQQWNKGKKEEFKDRREYTVGENEGK